MVEDSKHYQDLNSINSYNSRFVFSFRKLMKFMGPGFLICIAYIDPGNLSGDLNASLKGEYKLLWLLLVAQIFGFLFQTLSANIGIVTGNDLSQLCRKCYPRKASILLWLLTEAAIIGSDVQEVIGSAIALKILFSIPLWVGIMITIVDTLFILLIQFYGMRFIEYIFVFFLMVMSICFGINMGMIGGDGNEIVQGMFVPRIPSTATQAAIGLVGAIIMPHNLYLHSQLVHTRQINKDDQVQVQESKIYNAIETAISLIISFFINVCMIITFAHMNDKDLGIQDAGLALNKVFGGNYGNIIWGLGLLAAGQSSTITGTLAGQYVFQGFLNLKIERWKRSFISRGIAIIPSIITCLYQDPDKINENLNILQAIQLPFAVIPLLTFSRNSELMGNQRVGTILYWLLVIVTLLMFTLNIYGMVPEDFTSSNYWVYIFFISVTIYISVIIYIILQKVTIDKEAINELDVNAEQYQFRKHNQTTQIVADGNGDYSNMENQL